MAIREFFRDPTTGRFISRADAESLNATAYVDDTLTGERQIFPTYEQYVAASEEPEEPLEFWQRHTTERSEIWSDFEEGREDFTRLDIPDNARYYRVWFDVEQDDDYPGGMASTGWLGVEVWPPALDMIQNANILGFHRIAFDLR